MKYLFSILVAITLSAQATSSQPSSVLDIQLGDAGAIESNTSVKTLKIVPGTVRENAENLLHQFGWKMHRWDAANFYIDAEYEIDIANLEQGLDFLLDPYPLQAKMIKVNKTVLFVNKTKVQLE